MSYVRYTAEQKQAVVNDFVIARKSLRAIARERGISFRTVSEWCDAAKVRPMGFQAGQAARAHDGHQVLSAPPTDNDFWRPLFDLVIGLFEGATAIAKLPTDPTWVAAQNANDLGLLLSIATDKATAILEALERGYELRRRAEEAQAGEPGRIGPVGDGQFAASVGLH